MWVNAGPIEQVSETIVGNETKQSGVVAKSGVSSLSSAAADEKDEKGGELSSMRSSSSESLRCSVAISVPPSEAVGMGVAGVTSGCVDPSTASDGWVMLV